jgi:hypothetical protein
MMTSKTIATLSSALFAAFLAFAPLTAVLHAQMVERVQVTVPFAFQNGSELLPAGVYTLTEGSHFLTIQGHDVAGLAMSRVEDSGRNAPKTGKVVFQRYGDKYFLREVWQANSSAHTFCVRSNAEIKEQKAMQSQTASNKTAPTVVEVAAK